MKYKKYFRKTSLKQEGHGEIFLNEIYKFLHKQKISKRVINLNQATNILHKLFDSKKSQKNIKNKMKKIGQKILKKNIDEINLILKKV